MVSKQERRKQLTNAMREKAEDEFEKGLPMKREAFTGLFDYLDEELSNNDCDDTNRITREYLEKTGQKNIEPILEWLAAHGGYCDCEILANVEELF